MSSNESIFESCFISFAIIKTLARHWSRRLHFQGLRSSVNWYRFSECRNNYANESILAIRAIHWKSDHGWRKTDCISRSLVCLHSVECSSLYYTNPLIKLHTTAAVLYSLYFHYLFPYISPDLYKGKAIPITGRGSP
jgi:hypothetical protein